MADAASPNQLFELWRKQFEEGAQAWTRLVGQASATPAPDPTAFWRPVLDQGVQTWAKLFAQTPTTPDLLTQWKQFLDQWIEAWSKVLGQTMGTEQFAKLMGQSLDQFLVAQAPAKKAVDQQVDQALQALNLPSRSQLTAVAKQIVELEERIERLEDLIAVALRRLTDKGPIAPGIFTAGLISAVIGTRLPGPGAVYLSQSLKFVKPVRAGDTITARVDVLEVLPERNRIRLQTVCVNQRSEEVLSGEAWVMPSKARVVYEQRPRRTASLAVLALGPWALAAEAARLWAAMITSAARR